MNDKCTEPCSDLLRLEQQVRELQERNGSDHKELRGRLAQIETDDAVQKEQYKTILQKLDEVAAAVKTWEAKPGKRWETLVEKAVLAVAAAVLAFLLGKIGL